MSGKHIWNESRWAGKAKRRHTRMMDSTYNLIRLLYRLKLLPEDFDDDWEEEFRCYVNRVLGRI